MNFDYDGPLQILECETQIWSEGKPLPKTLSDRMAINSRRNTLGMSIEPGPGSDKTSYSFRTLLSTEE